MADAARAARAAALEEKKRKLEELRARKNRRADAEKSSPAAKPSSSKNLDDYIDGLLRTPAAKPAAVENKEDLASVQKEASKPAELKVADASSNNVIAEPAPAPVAPPVKKVETFEVSTQTDVDDFPRPEHEEDEPVDVVEKPQEQEVEEKDETPAATGAPEPKVLTEQEREEAVASAPFSSFLNTASKKVERVLGEPVLADLLVNFVGETDGAETADKQVDGSRFVSAQEKFESPKWTGTRDVTDMDWSPLHRELMLSSYHMPSTSSSTIGSAALTAISPDDSPSSSLAPRSGELQSDGLTLVWNMALPARPEHIFTCGSPVLASRFHPTESPLVLGACQSGQLVVWDVRAGRLPVQRSSKGHTHPISGMEIHERGSGLVTADSDGYLNFWSMGNLREPADSIRVTGNVSSLAVAPESNTLLCGDESGAIFAIPPSSSGGGGKSSRTSKRSVRKLATAEGHFGMVTSISTKKVKNNRAGMAKGFLRGAGGLVLSSGVDWTVQLWAPSYKDKPLLGFVNHSYDYMCDVQWSPSHASLFATASSNGNVGLWNLATSLDEPLGEIAVDKKNGLNKMKWSADGRRLLLAGGDLVQVLSLSEEVLRQKGDESERMMNQLTTRGLLDRV